jgi:long-chain fatty acid transport protein
MRTPRRVVLFICGATLLAAGSAYASEWDLFQHGGRATGQAGAFTARADDPAAITYNPAGIAKLTGLQVQVGIDFDSPKDIYHSSGTSYAAKHDINFPPTVYLSYKPGSSPFAFGFGIDSPFWTTENWAPSFNFPGRFITREFSLQLFEAHPVVAYDLGSGYSVGAGFRYDYGHLQQGDELFSADPALADTEIERTAKGNVSGAGWDVSAQYHSAVWGWGAVYRSQSKLTGDNTSIYNTHDNTDETGGTQIFPSGSSRQAFELVPEERAGIWVAPYPELRIELDVSHQQWSSEPDTVVTYSPNPSAAFPLPNTVHVRNWKDTNNVRLGVEGNLTDSWLLYAGGAYEMTPVPDHTVEPGFPRGNAYIAAVGLSYNLPHITFDAGGSFSFNQSRNAPNQQPFNPLAGGNYTGDDRVWSGSVRWRF